MGEVAFAEVVMRTKRHNSAGFTLIEVVVAITLMTLIMTILFLGLRISANGLRRGQQKLEEHARAMAENDAIQRQVAAAAPWNGIARMGADQKPVPLVGFSGSPQEMRFVTRESWQGKHERPSYMADYRVVKSVPGQQQLVMSEVGLTDDASVIAALMTPANDKTPVEDLGAPADAIDIAYYHPATAEQPAAWVAEWQPLVEQDFPRALRVRWTRGREVQVATFVLTLNHDPRLPQ